MSWRGVEKRLGRLAAPRDPCGAVRALPARHVFALMGGSLMGLVLVVIVLLLLFGGLPHWGYHSYGY
ncbi:MAG TPA: hypothetical protein VLQ80_10415, partial [Candidatus Saccharimonadia bacterium]|nr:hypothetical protein [Candidatus Saccharimonadia bacterium]